LLLGYSRQSYYQGIVYIHQKAYESDVIIEEVLRYRKHLKRIGTRKLLDEMQSFLTAHCFKIGRDAMFDLLAERGLLVTKRKRRGCVTTLSKHRFKKYPHIVRDFIPIAPNQLWVSDITYIHLSEGFAYLSLITDAYSRKIVGFYLSKDLSSRGPLAALKMALISNPHHDGLIHHSDRGVQYCCDEYVKLLEQHEIKISMTEKGDPLENALAERVNGILKQELLEEVFSDFETAQKEVAIACSTYNHLRPHGSIDNLKPAQAHQMRGTIKKRWTNYWQKNKGKEVLTV
jgi:transposase InsO family protein